MRGFGNGQTETSESPSRAGPTIHTIEPQEFYQIEATPQKQNRGNRVVCENLKFTLSPIPLESRAPAQEIPKAYDCEF